MKYLPHILIISFVFLLAPTAQVVSYAGEIETWKEEVRMNPDDAYAHFGLGYAYVISGKWKEAIKSYKQAIRINPDYAEAHCALGYVYGNPAGLGKYQEAIKSFKQAIRLDPDYAEAHFNLGGVYSYLNDRDSANSVKCKYFRISNDSSLMALLDLNLKTTNLLLL